MVGEIPNLKYLELQNKYQHLKNLEMNENNPKAFLPVHNIVGVNNYIKIKMQVRQRVCLEGEPVVELTKIGWMVA